MFINAIHAIILINTYINFSQILHADLCKYVLLLLFAKVRQSSSTQREVVIVAYGRLPYQRCR